MKNELAIKYTKEYSTWRDHLKQYWRQIDKNQEMYEFYKREESQTESTVSLNTPFTIVESLVAKGNDTTLSVTVKAKGKNDMADFEQWVGAIVKDAIEDKDVEAIVGSFRKIKEQFEREFYIKGNAVAEINWLYRTTITNGQKKIVADAPYTKVLPLKSVIFNPAKTLCDSDVYYLEKNTTWKELKDKEYDPKTGKGIYKNLGGLKTTIQEDGNQVDDEEEQYISGDKKISRKVEPIKLLERWEGAKLCVIANGSVIIREEYDPFQIGRHNLLTAMNYTIVGRPYAYGEIDAIYKTVRAQDTVVNQNIEIINRYLRPAVVIDKNSNFDIDAVITVLESGGVTYGDPQMIGNIPSQLPPNQAFMTIDNLQQAIERAARFSPYATGQPAQSTDKTNGTMGGIQSIQAAAEPNFQVKLDAIQDSFMSPLARVYLQMIANLMGENDLRYAELKGVNPQWVAASKGILLGKATLRDMLISGMVSPDEVSQVFAEQGVNPNPNIEQTLLFDVDWVIDIKLDNQSKADKIQEAERKIGVIKLGQEMGVQFHPERTITRIGHEEGIDDIEELFMSEEEKAQQQQQMMASQQMEMQNQQQQMQMQQKAEEQRMMMSAKQAQMQQAMKEQAFNQQMAQKAAQHDLNMQLKQQAMMQRKG